MAVLFGSSDEYVDVVVHSVARGWLCHVAVVSRGG